MTDPLTPTEFERAEGASDWRVIGDGATALFRTATFAAGARLVAAIGELDGAEGHPPDVDLRPGGVTVRLVTCTDGYMGMTTSDLDLARRISALAREQGATPDPSAVQSVLVIVESMAPPAVMPFWRAVLGYVDRPDSPEDLVDPQGRGPALWFETLGEARPHAGGIHLAAWVPREQAEARVAAAVAAGGRMVRDQFAPAWWTLADAAGNEADVASIASRD
jgi:4a-hydroxytetrahydrobiopterin dehydratase